METEGMMHRPIVIQVVLLTLGVFSALHCTLLSVAPNLYLRLLAKDRSAAVPSVSWTLRLYCAALSVVVAVWVYAVVAALR
jgi:hypothetical protein